MSGSRAPLLQFGVFEMDLQTGELWKAGVRVRLQPQPFTVLALLASRPGEVISRQEIVGQIWGEQTHVDPGGLNYCIKQIRAALEDVADHPHYIETLPRRGYRFISSIEKHDRARAVPSKRLMLAVLPFGNLTGDPEQEYFAEGMTEELIMQLGRLNPRKLGVIAFTSAMQYKHTRKGIDQIGNQLDVDFVVEGSVRRGGERVRIAAQLVKVSDQSHLWAEAYNRTLEDVITIQTDVAKRVARSLEVELLESGQAVVGRTFTRHSAAYEAYLKGLFYWNRRTEEGFRNAGEHFQEAVEKDPDYSLAYVGLADVYHVAALYSDLPPKEAHERANAATQKALEIDDSLAETHTTLAYGKFRYGWDWPGSETAFKFALERTPNYVPGNYRYALFLTAMGRFEEALERMKLALQLDPMAPVANAYLGWILYFARRYDEAIDQLCNLFGEIEPNFPLGRYFLGLAYLQKGRYEDAIAELQMARESTGLHPIAMGVISHAHYRAGRKAEARKWLYDLK